MGKSRQNEDYEISSDGDDEAEIRREFERSMNVYEETKKIRDREKQREKLYNAAREKIISKLLEDNLRMKLELNKELPKNNLNDYMKELYDENKGLRNELTKNEDAKYPIHYFLTMRPPPIITYEEFIKVVKDLFKKVWLKDYIYVIEQSSTNLDELGKGFHLHAIIKRNDKRPAQMIREIKSTVGKIGDADKQCFLDIEAIFNNEIGLRNRLNYILGTKKSTEANQKDLKQEMDIIFRQKKELKDYYFFGEFFSPYITELLNAC